MATLIRDLRFALRGLRREPGVSMFVCVALALGIGANAAMFGLADRLLLGGPPHVRDASHVVRVYASVRPPGQPAVTTSTFGQVMVDLLRQDADTFDALATYAINTGRLDRGARARRIRIGYASAELFPLLGVEAALGRFPSARDDAPSGAEPVAVLSHSAWLDWFAGADDVLGRSVVVDDAALRVIGVAPPGFTGPQHGRVDVWAPMNLLSPGVTEDFQASWNAQWLHIAGRLRPGVDRERAGERATDIFRRGYAGGDPLIADARLHMASLRTGDDGTDLAEVLVLRWLIGIAVIVLLIACANVVNLQLARGVRRGHEVAVRAALGASRLRLIRLLLIESVVLAVAGATLGLGVAGLVTAVARASLFTAVAWSGPLVDVRVAGFALALAMITGLAVGLIPAWRASSATVTGLLTSGGRDAGGRTGRLRETLTVAQAALSVALLVGAGLCVRSLGAIATLDLGLDADAVLVVEVDRAGLGALPPGTAREAERARRRAFFLNHLARIRAMPGVERASMAVGLPFGYRFGVPLRVPGIDEIPALESGGPSISAVAPDYFETVGTPIVRGRPFDARDGAGTEPVAIVSRTMADTVWPGLDPLGRCLVIGGNAGGGEGASVAPPCTRVVGVAGDTRRSRLRETPVMHYYIPAGQESGFGGAVLLVRPSDASGRIVPELRRWLTSVDPAIAYVSAETIQTRVDPQIQPWRQGASVFFLSGVLALIVTGMGLYSVMSYLIADRRREIGVRLALGAQHGDIVRLVLRASVGMAVVGIAIGEIATALAARWVAPYLFDTSARDPLVYTATAAVLVIVALGAALVPARRARAVNPIEALRAG